MISTRKRLFGAALCFATLPGVANASLVLDIQQTGADVVASFGGSFNLTGLSGSLFFNKSGSEIRGNPGFFEHAPPETLFTCYHGGTTGPASWGPGSTLYKPATGSGSYFAFNASYGPLGPLLCFDPSYASGDSLSGGAVFDGQTLSSLGLSVGRYVYTGPNDTLTVTIGSPVDTNVPEPATWAMVAGGFGVMGATIRRRRTMFAAA